MKALLLALTVVTSLTGIVLRVEGHGHMISPMSRTSMFVMDRDQWPTQPAYWNNKGVWCNNVKQDMDYGQCARCGFALGDGEGDHGGLYGKGIIVQNYTSGAIIEVTVEISAPHYGYFEHELCPIEQENDSCFQRLAIIEGTHPVPVGHPRMCVPNQDEGRDIIMKAQVQLPSGVRCSRCTMRWTYRTSYESSPDWETWDPCWHPEPTQTFRNCADVSIY